MSFKNLEQRFNENVNTLYAGATTKFAGGSPSNGRSDDPLIVRRPGEGYWGAMEDRSTPVRSAQQDLRRLTLFQLRPGGIKFLAKQQLLQTGNTFEFTRALNPTFVVGNAIPFLHVKRNLRPLTELVGKTDKSYGNVKTMGQLQFSSYNSLKSKGIPSFYNKEEPGSTAASRPGIASSLANRFLAPLKALKDTVTGTLSAFSPLQKRNIGEIKDKWGKESWPLSRPELIEYSKGIQQILAQNQRKGSNDVKTGTGLTFTPTTDRYADRNNPAVIQTTQNVISFIKYFNPGQSLASTGPGVDKPSSVKAKRNSSEGNLVEPLQQNQGKISYIKDPANEVTKNFLNSAVYQPAYAPINSNFDDPISVSFAMGKQPPVRFRAFIKDLVETSNPQYQAFQYIGRIEKFINYTGVQRDISFKLAIIAFGQDELDMVWRRINYLTGLTFPYGFTRGIMQPNIVRLTLGGVYSDQPGYINSLTTNFNEPTETWDIDKDVPIGATMDMKFTLIEKATRVADSPFYGITDGDGRADKNPMSGFSKQIPIPDPRLDSLDPMKIPTVGSITTKTEKRIPNLADSTRNLADVTRPDSFISSVIRNANLNTNIPTPVIRLNQPQITFPNNRLPGT